jgi:hypothetical protein
MLQLSEAIAGFVDLPAVVAAAVIALAVVAFAPRKARALVLWFAQYAAFVALVLVAIAAGRQGYATGGAIGRSHELNDLGQLYYAVAGAIVGGLAGLTAAALVVALFFVLLEIKDNTRG